MTLPLFARSLSRTARRRMLLGAAAFGAALLLLITRTLVGGQEPDRKQAVQPPRTATDVRRPEVGVQTGTIGMVAVDRVHEAPGIVRPELEAVVGTRVTGRIVSVLVREGDSVRRGQPLVRLDSRDLQAAIRQADANLRAASVGYDAARVTVAMESALSSAKVAQAEARVSEAEAALKAAQARLELLVNGPRKQERKQANLATAQARANLALAESNLRRYQVLVNEGAISRQTFETASAQVDVARAQYEAARQGESLSDEGSREEDIRAAREAVRLAEAGLGQARAGLQQARAGTRQVEVRQQEARVSQAQIGQSRAALDIARVALDYSVIAAPFDGVVAARLIDPGALATPATPLLRIQGGALRLEASVPESLAPSARSGGAVQLVLDAIPGVAFAGRVVEVAPQGDPASHTFTVKAGAAGMSGARSGMFGRMRLRVGQDRKLMVPVSAVWEREGLHYVWAVVEGRAVLRLVTVGEQTGDAYAVLSGLTEGERIVTVGRTQVREGMRLGESGAGGR